MDFFPPIVKHFIYPLWAKKNGLNRLIYLKEYEKTQFFSPDNLKELQWQRFQHLLKHAYSNCSFYTKRFDQANLKPEDIKTPDDLIKIPILTKKDIQDNLKT